MYVNVNGKTEYWLHIICHQYENNKVHVSCLIIAGYNILLCILLLR